MKISADEVLAEFRDWMEEWPECPAKSWLRAAPPGQADVRRAVERVTVRAARAAVPA